MASRHSLKHSPLNGAGGTDLRAGGRKRWAGPHHRSSGSGLKARWLAAAVAIATAGACALTSLHAASAASSDTTPPTQPGAITSSSLTATSVSLSWGGSSDNVGIEGYRVYRGVGTGTPSTLIATTDAVTSYKATHLYSGTTYTFGIVAIDPSNNKSPMTTKSITTSSSTDTTAPSAPSSTSVSFRVFSGSRIDVVWAASSSTDVAGYRVYRNGTQVGAVDLPNTPRFSDNGLSPSTSYSYTIKAVDSAGNLSAATTAKSAKTLAASTVLIARGPLLSNVTGTSAVISWWTNLATSGSVGINGSTFTDSTTVQHHLVTVSGLSPATSYPYTVTSNGVTASGTLTTAATTGQTFTFAAIGDFGGGSTGETQNATNIAGAGTQFVQTVGDDIYPSSGLPDPSFSTTYSDFDQRMFKPFAAVIKNQAFFPANGNKEYYGDGEFWDAFPMPGSNHSWYSYDWGNAHILVLDSEQPFATGTDQYNFAQADLAAHQSATWRIVALQRPPYSSSSSNSSSLPVRQYLVPLFQAQHVNLVLSGNSHNYERNVPMTNGAAATGGVTYIVTGGGGNGFNPFTLAQPSYSAFREASYYEYAKVTVSPTQLRVDAVRADTNTVFDTTTIDSGAPPPPDTTPPTVPTGVSAHAVSSSEIDLSWTASTDNVGVTGYRIYRDGASTPLTTVTGTSYQDTGLAASSTHSYTVSAIDAANNESGKSTPPASDTTLSGGGGGGSTPALVQSASGTSASGLTATFGAPTAAGHLLVLSASVYTGATAPVTSVTDSANNTWQRATGPSFVAGHNSDGELWYAANAAPTTSVTVHTAATSVALQVQEFSGVAASSPLDTTAGASNTSTTASAGPITAAAGELVVGFAAGHSNAEAMTLSAPLTAVQPQTTTSGSIASVITGYAVPASAGGVSVSATFGTAMYWAAGVAAFRAGP